MEEKDLTKPEETPEESQLETPQPDQPVETPEEVPSEEGSVTAEEIEAVRAQGRESLVREHNEHSGGAEVQEGGVTQQREEHQERTSTNE
jgi:hypothetical protein